jgi:hypothetical protein
LDQVEKRMDRIELLLEIMRKSQAGERYWRKSTEGEDKS